MATDYVSSPLTPKGKIIMGIGCGILTVVIRLYGGYPEGVSYAILIMNLLVPLIDRYTVPRVFGEEKKKWAT
jgi:electron transport complex protein RnfD